MIIAPIIVQYPKTGLLYWGIIAVLTAVLAMAILDSKKPTPGHHEQY